MSVLILGFDKESILLPPFILSTISSFVKQLFKK